MAEDRLGNIERFLARLCEQGDKMDSKISQMDSKISKMDSDIMQLVSLVIEDPTNKGKEQVGTNSNDMVQAGFLPALGPHMEKQQYRLELHSVVGTKDEKGAYYVFKGEPISITVTIKKPDGTPVPTDDALASVTVEVVVLPGSFFNPTSVRCWSKEAFEESMNSLRGRMTVKNSIFQLNEGSAVHEGAKIIRNSGKKEVKLGVMIHESNTNIGGRRVFEGVSNSFKVKEPPRRPKNPAKHATESTAISEAQTPGSSSQPTTNGYKRVRTDESQMCGQNVQGSSAMDMPQYTAPPAYPPTATNHATMGELLSDVQSIQHHPMEIIQQPTFAQTMQQPGDGQDQPGYPQSNEVNVYLAENLGTNSQGNITTPASLFYRCCFYEGSRSIPTLTSFKKAAWRMKDYYRVFGFLAERSLSVYVDARWGQPGRQHAGHAPSAPGCRATPTICVTAQPGREMLFASAQPASTHHPVIQIGTCKKILYMAGQVGPHASIQTHVCIPCRTERKEQGTVRSHTEHAAPNKAFAGNRAEEVVKAAAAIGISQQQTMNEIVEVMGHLDINSYPVATARKMGVMSRQATHKEIDVLIESHEASLAKQTKHASCGDMEDSTAKSFDQFVVLDMKATCLGEEERKIYGKEEPFTPEIIEVSSVLVDAATGHLLESKFHTYVRPAEHPVLTKFCMESNNMKQEHVEDNGAMKLSKALQMHETWLEKNGGGGGALRRAVVTWGDWACRTMLKQECRRKGLHIPDYFRRWINLKKPFAARYGDIYWQRPVLVAFEATELEWEGSPKGGRSHVLNKARLLALLIREGATLAVTGELPSM